MILIYPPISIPSEPPIGIANLSGALKKHSVSHEIVDLNIEGIYWILKNASPSDDIWSKRAMKNMEKNMENLKNGTLFKNMGRYKKAIFEINHILETYALKKGIKITLSDYTDKNFSPLKSKDLIESAKYFSENPFYNYFSERLTSLLSSNSTDFIGISINYLSQALCAFAIIGFLKTNYPYIKIIAGGGLINSWIKRGAKKDLFKGLIDQMVAGQGESHLLSLLNITPLKHLVYTPNYEKFKKELYLSYGFVLPYSTSTGCYWGRCSFCPERAEGNIYIQKEPEVVAQQLKDIVNETKPSLIHFTDNAIHPYVLDTIIKNPPDALWYGFVRINKEMEDLDYCLKLKQSGCVMLKIGIETADQDVLKTMKKGLNIETAKKVLKNLKIAGIGTYIYLLFGTPFETDKSHKKTMNFVIEYHDLIDFMNIAIFNMPVNTPDAKETIVKSFYEGDLSLYTDFEHPHGLDRLHVRRFIEKTFKKQPEIKTIIDRQPPFFTSNHAPFFVMAKS